MTQTAEMMQIRSLIISTISKREACKADMERWYQENPNRHYPKLNEVSLIDATLSQLDSIYKNLWDQYNAKP